MPKSKAAAGKKKTKKSASKLSQKLAPSAKPKRRLFTGIKTLFTLDRAFRKAARRVTADDLDRIDGAAFVSENGRIVWVGKEKDLPREFKNAIKSEDLQGAVVLPAFVESHTHLIYAGNRAAEFERRNQGESYQSIAKSGGGILATLIPTREASEKELTAIGQERAERFLKQGVSTIEVKSGYALTAEGEMKMLRAAGAIRRARIVRTFLGAHAIPKEFKSAEAYIDYLLEEALPQLKKEGLACRADIFIEQGYFSKELGKKYLSRFREEGFDLAVHADQLSRCGGAELAVELKARSAEHLIQINDEDIRKLSASEVTCVLLPTADLYMNCAYPPARKLIDQGARVALATDLNPGTSPSFDVALVGVLARIYMKMSLPETIVAYTLGGAYALGLEKELGSISKGKLADFVVLEGEMEELFLEAGRQPVARLYREGERLL